MSRYDDSDDVGGRPSPGDPLDQVSGERRWSRSGRQEARGQDQPSRDAGRRGGRRRGKEIVLGAAAILSHTIALGLPAGWAAWDHSRKYGLRTNRISAGLTETIM